MDLPQYVKIGHITYTVQPAEPTLGVDKTDIGTWNRYCGEIVYAECMILIKDEQHEQSKRATLMHEAVHGVLWNAGQYDANANEGLVNALAYGLVALLRDNPELVAYLTEARA